MGTGAVLIGAVFRVCGGGIEFVKTTREGPCFGCDCSDCAFAAMTKVKKTEMPIQIRFFIVMVRGEIVELLLRMPRGNADWQYKDFRTLTPIVNHFSKEKGQNRLRKQVARTFSVTGVLATRIRERLRLFVCLSGKAY